MRFYFFSIIIIFFCPGSFHLSSFYVPAPHLFYFKYSVSPPGTRLGAYPIFRHVATSLIPYVDTGLFLFGRAEIELSLPRFELGDFWLNFPIFWAPSGYLGLSKVSKLKIYPLADVYQSGKSNPRISAHKTSSIPSLRVVGLQEYTTTPN